MPGWTAACLVALILVTVSVRLADPTGWLGSDDAAYRAAAEHILSGTTIERVHHQYGRLAVIVPIAASLWAFGDGPVSVILPTFLASTLCVVMVAVLGRLLWGWWAGLCAATAVSFLPFFRMLSTAAYPDVHACLWVTTAAVLAVSTGRINKCHLTALTCIGCGFALGMAASAKVLALSACVGIACLLWTQAADTRRFTFATAWVVAGGMLSAAVDGLFYQWAAGDFFYKLHALTASQADPALFNISTDPSASRVSAWDRLAMLLQPHSSEWGWIGVTFWPATVLTFLLSKPGRAVALWAAGAYLLIALLPVGFHDGAKPYPFFDGRAVLTTCIPFALCLGWSLHNVIRWQAPPRWVPRLCPVAAACLMLIALPYPGSLRGFRDRPTQRVGRAVEQLVATTTWEPGCRIFVTPSLYLRYALLFPPHLRSCLRVVAAAGAPQWWRRAAADIESRFEPLPSAGNVYLLATPAQLEGSGEFWDYGITLPASALAEWRTRTPTARIVRRADKSIGPPRHDATGATTLLVLLAPDRKDAA